MAQEYIKFDPIAFRHLLEGNAVRNILISTGAVKDEQVRKVIFNTISVFEGHGIGAVEAIQIMSELGDALK